MVPLNGSLKGSIIGFYIRGLNKAMRVQGLGFEKLSAMRV